MARVTKNALLKGLSGKLHDIVFKSYSGVTVVSKYPDMSRVKRTKAQKQQSTRFADAVLYARSIPLNPELLKKYQKLSKSEKRTVYHLALSDYMNDPAKSLTGLELVPPARGKTKRKRR